MVIICVFSCDAAETNAEYTPNKSSMRAIILRIIIIVSWTVEDAKGFFWVGIISLVPWADNSVSFDGLEPPP